MQLHGAIHDLDDVAQYFMKNQDIHKLRSVSKNNKLQND